MSTTNGNDATENGEAGQPQIGIVNDLVGQPDQADDPAFVDSGEDESEEEPDDHLLYRDRAEWADVTPVEQDDGPYTVVRIKYSEAFKDAYDYFRAILKSGEKSLRALELVTTCCRLNPSNYTAWTVRRDILLSLGADLREEMAFIEEMIVKQPKNYQVWHHRRALCLELNDGSDEKRLTSLLLEVDPKNYHAWQHRVYCVQHWSLWDGELDYTTKLISEDVRNNSAWNHRFVILKATAGFADAIKLEQEIHYSMEKIRLAPSNESAWSYLRGLLRNASIQYASNQNGDQEGAQISLTGHLCDHPAVNAMVVDLLEAGCRQAQLLSFQLDSAVDLLKKEVAHQRGAGDHADDQIRPDKGKFEQLLTMCSELATKYDTIRCNYWQYYAKKLSTDFNMPKVMMMS